MNGAKDAHKGGWGKKIFAASTGIGGLALLGLLAGKGKEAPEGHYPPTTSGPQ